MTTIQRTRPRMGERQEEPLEQPKELVDVMAKDAADPSELAEYGNGALLAQGKDFDGTPLNLFEVDLETLKDPQTGEVHGLNIGWFSNGCRNKFDPDEILAQGYDGFRFVGRGVDETHITCGRSSTLPDGREVFNVWGETCVGMQRGNYAVEFVDCTVHCAPVAKGKAIHAGTEGYQIFPRFQVRGVRMNVVADDPRPWRLTLKDGTVVDKQARSTWGIFTYQADIYLKDCNIDVRKAGEHGIYGHGTAGGGYFIEGCTIKSGSEGIKLRSDDRESEWAGNKVAIVIRDCELGPWFMPHAWRGGAGIVLQGAAAQLVWIERCVFRPGAEGHAQASAGRRSYMIAVSTEGESYSADSPSQSADSYGYGYVVVRNCAGEATGPGPDWFDNIVRVGRNGGVQKVARGFWMDGCGFFARNLVVSVSSGVPYTFTGNNTEAIKEFCRDKLGMDATSDAIYFDGGLKTLAEDRIAPAPELR